MGFKKAILVLLLLIILTMGAVSANDNVNNLTAVDTQNYTESIVDNIDIVSDEDEIIISGIVAMVETFQYLSMMNYVRSMMLNLMKMS